MRGFKELAVLESNPCKHIYTPVTFSLNGINQKLHKITNYIIVYHDITI